MGGAQEATEAETAKGDVYKPSVLNAYNCDVNVYALDRKVMDKVDITRDEHGRT